jgi:hypothetical protein
MLKQITRIKRVDEELCIKGGLDTCDSVHVNIAVNGAAISPMKVRSWRWAAIRSRGGPGFLTDEPAPAQRPSSALARIATAEDYFAGSAMSAVVGCESRHLNMESNSPIYAS